MAKLSSELEAYFFSPDRGESVTLEDILELAEGRGFGILFVLLSLPSALPVPAPGYSTPFGIVLFLLAGQLAVGSRQPWFPKKWRDRPIPLEKVRSLLKTALPWLRRVETLSRPRLTRVCTSAAGRAVIGTAICIMSLSMMAPVPTTNTAPAMGIFLTGFGLLDDDGAIAIAGCTFGILATIAAWIAVIWFGASLTNMIKTLF